MRMVMLRRKAMVLLAGCLVLLFLGVWAYQSEQQRALAALGDTVPVVVAARALDAWVPITARDVSVQQVPIRFAGPERLPAPDDVDGKMLIAPIPEGAAIPGYAIYSGPDLQPHQRTWELREAAKVILDRSIRPGDRVDVLAAGSTDGEGIVRAVLSGVPVVAVRQEEKELAVTLALTLDEGKVLMEAENFARQVRMVRNPAPVPEVAMKQP